MRSLLVFRLLFFSRLIWIFVSSSAACDGMYARQQNFVRGFPWHTERGYTAATGITVGTARDDCAAPGENVGSTYGRNPPRCLTLMPASVVSLRSLLRSM